MLKVAALAIFLVCIGVAYAYGEFFFDEPFEVHALEFGTEVSYIDYKEPGLMENEGFMYGLIFSYTYRGWASPDVYPREFDRFMFKVEGKASYGEVDYDSLGTGSSDGIEDYMLEFRGLGGYDVIISHSLLLTPYTGIGYRYLNDDSSGTLTTTGNGGYERESRYLYSPIGIIASFRFNKYWTIRFTGEYDYFWQGKQITHLSDVSPFYSNPTNKQRRGYGVRSYIELVKKGEKIDFVIAPFIKYWSIKKSEVKDYFFIGFNMGPGWEPKNHTTEIGAKCAVVF